MGGNPSTLVGFHALLRGSEYAWKRPVSEWTAEEGLARSDATFLPAEGPEGPAAMGDDYVPKAMQLRIRGRKLTFSAMAARSFSTRRWAHCAW